MKSFEGYLKQKLGDSYVLLAGGGSKPISDFSLSNHTHNHIPWGWDVVNESNYTTVGAAKTRLAEILGSQDTGIGYNVTVNASVITQWDSDSASIYPTSVYSIMKIGGGYSGSWYGQWLVSGYSLDRVGILGREANTWSGLKWLAWTSDLDSYLLKSGGTMTGNITIGNSTFYASGSNGGINSLAITDDCILGDCNIGGHLGLKSLNSSDAGISFYNSSGLQLGRFTVNSQGNPSWNDIGFSLSGHSHTSLSVVASISGSTHAEALSTYFSNNYTTVPRNQITGYYSNAYSNGSLCIGYWIPGYNSNPHGGFFVCHYDKPWYVGILNGSYSEQQIITSASIGSQSVNYANSAGSVSNYMYVSDWQVNVNDYYNYNGVIAGKLYSASNVPKNYYAFLHAGGGAYYMEFNARGTELFFRSSSEDGYTPAWLTIIHSGNIGSQSVSHASSADFLPPCYNGGDQPNPQSYFNNNIGCRVAMTRYADLGMGTSWHDTLWINGYSGGDVTSMCALHFKRNGEPRFAISSQAHTSTGYGTMYEVITAYNIASQSVNYASSSYTSYHIAPQSYTPTNNTVAGHKAGIVNWMSSQGGTGIGDHVIVGASIIDQWDSDSAYYYDSSVYAMIKIGGGYNYTTYGQWLLSGYSTNRVGVVGRDANNWGRIRWLLESIGDQSISGNLTATNFYTTSDRNKKYNISSLSQHIRKFTLKETDKDMYGVIAQEVPEMFRDGEEGEYTVNYNSVLSYYVGCLENKVAELEEKIKELENK